MTAFIPQYDFWIKGAQEPHSTNATSVFARRSYATLSKGISGLELNTKFNPELNPELNPEFNTELNTKFNTELNTAMTVASLAVGLAFILVLDALCSFVSWKVNTVEVTPSQGKSVSQQDPA